MRLARLILYTRNTEEMVAFYTDFFGYSVRENSGDRIVELVPPGRGTGLMLHPLGKGRREGQSIVKLIFDVSNVAEEKRQFENRGLRFGPVHNVDGYCFANAKDPSGTSIQITSRASQAPQTELRPV